MKCYTKCLLAIPFHYQLDRNSLSAFETGYFLNLQSVCTPWQSCTADRHYRRQQKRALCEKSSQPACNLVTSNCSRERSMSRDTQHTLVWFFSSHQNSTCPANSRKACPGLLHHSTMHLCVSSRNLHELNSGRSHPQAALDPCSVAMPPSTVGLQNASKDSVKSC